MNPVETAMQSVERRQEALQRYGLIIESMTEGVSLSTPEGIIVYTNPAEDRMFGYAPGELIGRHVSIQNAYPAKENERRVADVIAALKADGYWDGEWNNRRKDGSVFVTASRITAVEVDGGTHWLCVQRDITAMKQAEADLRESASRLDLALTAHRIGIFDWFIQTGRVVWSEHEEQLFGLQSGSFGGTIANWTERVHPDDVEPMNEAMQQAMAERREHFDFAFRIRRADGEIRWIEGVARFIYANDGTPERMIGTNMDVTERRRAELHQRLLVNELNHRVKNTLAIVQGLAQQSFRSPAIPDEPRLAFEARLAALSSAHDLLTREHWEKVLLAELVRDALAPFGGLSERVSADGPDLPLRPQMALSLALALHELGTNAAKYGALSVPDGRVEIAWEAADGQLRLVWRESGGPPVAAPLRRGFGTRLIERSLAAELGGSASIHFPADGAICTIVAPLG